MVDSLEQMTTRLRAFARERDWEQYHTAKNLTAAVAGEAGELVAVLQWASGDDDVECFRSALEEEVADVLIYLVRLCDVNGVDPIAVACRKIEQNAIRYPASRG